jgi:hypothetical protein
MISDELGKELRGAFARTAAVIEVPEQVRERLAGHDYRPGTVRRRRLTAITAGALATAAGVAIPLAAAGPQTAAAGVTVRLSAFYTFRLPAGYTLTSSDSAHCRLRPPLLATKLRRGDPTLGHRYAAIEAAACVSMGLNRSYRPTPAMPDPDVPPGTRPVHIGRYHGAIGIFGSPATPRRELWVQLPIGHGRMQDLAVAEFGLSPRALIRLVARGLECQGHC